ncbi:MAG: cyclase family protein [SAR324 cluster bacterium]|nr:cyclase family protein [SAR324 cluster bacterium]
MFAMFNNRKIHDISVLLGEESIDHPNVKPFKRELKWNLSESGGCDYSYLEMTAHAGTHIDMPSHFFQAGKSIDQLPVDSFIFPAQVVLIENSKLITKEELSHFDIKKNEALLFKTKNSISGICKNGEYRDDYVYLSEDAAGYCAKKGVALVGIDYISIEESSDNSFPAHKKILGNNTLVLEGINLEKVQAGSYTLMCLPLKIKNGEASPVRAILIESIL